MWEGILHGPCLTTLSGYMDIPLGLGFIMLIMPLSRELENYQRLGTKISLLTIRHTNLVLMGHLKNNSLQEIH